MMTIIVHISFARNKEEKFSFAIHPTMANVGKKEGKILFIILSEKSNEGRMKNVC